MKEIKRHPIYSDYGCDENGVVYSFKWNKVISIKGNIVKGYRRFNISNNNKTKGYTFHKFIWECFNGYILTETICGESLTIDHIDRDTFNNSISNLRVLTLRDNVQRAKNKTSIYTGVFWDSNRNKFRSEIRHDGKSSYLGRYENEYEAAKSFDDAYEKINGVRPNKTI